MLNSNKKNIKDLGIVTSVIMVMLMSFLMYEILFRNSKVELQSRVE